MIRMEAAGGLAVTTTVDTSASRAQLIADDTPARLAAKDSTLWGPAAEAEAAVRLGWVDTHERSRELLPRLAELRTKLRAKGLTRVVLAGMGGSSLAPEVITRTLDVPLTVLDTTDPGQIRAALAQDLENTVVVVSSKSGGTVETDSHRRAFWQAFEDHGLSDIGGRFVIVTDPGSPLETIGNEMGAEVILADSDVGGRYSALTAFGLVPSYLAGVDVEELIDQAAEFAASSQDEKENPALTLGAALASRPTVTIAPDGSGIVGLGDWAEQLIAESTGKDGLGVLPVVVDAPSAPGFTGEDVLAVTVGGSAVAHLPTSGHLALPDLAVNGPLGAQFLAWELATAYAGKLIGIDPFNQPNVTESKNNTNAILEKGLPDEAPRFTEGAVEVYGGEGDTLASALRGLLASLGEGGYVSVMAYLDRVADAGAGGLRDLLARATTAPVTFGWGPRFLHSTGQFHKGGRPTGAFLQITGAVSDDLDVPGKPFTFGQLQAAQAAGDRQALSSRSYPLLRLHLTDRAQGIAQILAAVKELA
ncbi:glucose-6-phosphate isomerase [Actinorhabdospora filicis]|uniref:Glucose-6-phosphate isomerase n=2 Tax=Actinorhabdospora filicis TaxID=1785913 RepID=A0A9W6SL03_9ACTN|nr:glucose-6-phosphate isomerase [Actinorhabdospora filicis]